MSLIVDIHKDFGAFKLDMAFEAEEGVLGLLGSSGCGKSMTLRCIAGIETPDKGTIELNGVTLFDSKKHVNLPPQARHVGYLFQNYALFPNMSVKKNIMLGMRKAKKDKQKALNDILRLTRLEGLEERRPNQLSGGQQQRTALARILVSEPNILMLDEPFSALDAFLREQLQVETKALLEQYGGISLLVTHSRDEAYQLCSKIALISRGGVIALKPAKELFADPETVEGALMTGCKNISRAMKAGEYELDALDWGVRLTCAKPVRDDVCAVGIRGHYFNEKTRQNRSDIRIVSMVEELFEWNVQFRCKNQTEDSQNLWWRVPKDRKPQDEVTALGVAAVNVMPLSHACIPGEGSV